MNEPLISVIVPVYKVEPYLRKCLDSIIGQTYRNLEIILVDDGSPDDCGMICDEYAVKDTRIRVIHKANGGLSSARNAGLAAASGEWIGWVDSDDWIEADMFEYLLGGATRTGADIAICGRVEHSLRQSTTRAFTSERLLNTQKAMGFLLEDDLVQNYLWNKLWRRELFDWLTFPNGHACTDLALAYKLFERAQRVIGLTEVKYNYLRRIGSISMNGNLPNSYSCYSFARQRIDDMLPRWLQYRELLERQCTVFALGLLINYWRSSKEQRREYFPKMREIAKDVRLYSKDAMRNASLGLAGKMILRLAPYTNGAAFAGMRFISWGYKLKHAGFNADHAVCLLLDLVAVRLLAGQLACV